MKDTTTNTSNDLSLKEDLLNTTDKENSNSEELVKYEHIKDTPFTTVRVWNDENNRNEWHVLLGKYRLNEKPFVSEKQAEDECKIVDWNKIVQVLQIMLEKQEEINKLKN